MPPARATNVNRSSRSTSASETDSLAVQARRLTRIVDMWWPGGDVVTTGKEMQSMTDDAIIDLRESANGRKLRVITLVERLSEWEPGFFERLNRAGPHATAAARDAKHRLNTGQSNGRSEDARKVRDAMPKWQEWVPPLGDRTMRGMKHKQCAEALAPPNLDFTKEEYVVVTQFIVDGIPPMAPECWGRFMWAKGQFNRQRPSIGLLEGELLLSSATAILFSPSSSMPSTVQASGGARGHIRRRGPIGIAKKYELTEVTTGFIAYVACVTRHALTAEDQFSEVCGGFSYIRFYYLVREFLESPKYERWTKALIDRWNEKLFSGYDFGLSSITPVDEANVTLHMLDAELAGLEITAEDVGLE
ncbi:hypothetical protein FRC06_000215 [Ceratobasidium sp. 370]|nr:hypothetical protein FRC06_000215 [Ceratobasidium sp. 370]